MAGKVEVYKSKKSTFFARKIWQGFDLFHWLGDCENLLPPARPVMPEEIKVKESDFYQLINAVDSQRVDLSKMKEELARLTKLLERMQPAPNPANPSNPAAH
jgi:hypothetical protein